MIKKYVKFFSLSTFTLVGFLLNGVAFAGIEISEIMYDVDGTDTGREWIEVYNSGADNIDFSKYKLFEAGVNHGITNPGEDGIVNNSSYAVIADDPTKFKIDFPTYSGKLFDSTFSLSNDGETLSIKDNTLNIVDSVGYDISLGAKGDGKSLQKINGSWVASLPTPGLENIYTNDIPPTTATSTDQTATTTATSTATSTATTTFVTQTITKTVVKYISVHSNPEDLSGYQGESTLEISAGRERLTYVGVPIKFSAKHKSTQGFNNSIDYSWTYGDGSKDTGIDVSHTYKYPGEYVVVLNGESGSEKAVSKTVVKVLDPNISITLISSGDFEIKNLGSEDINLGGWEVKDAVSKFIFPEDTIVGAGKSITIPKEYSKISGENDIELLIFDPSKNLVAQTQSVGYSFTASTHTPITKIDQNADISKLDINDKEVLAFINTFKKDSSEPKVFAAGTSSRDISVIISPVTLATPSINISTSSNFGLNQVATVIESSTTTKSFWRKLFGLPMNGIKAIGRIFYDVE